MISNDIYYCNNLYILINYENNNICLNYLYFISFTVNITEDIKDTYLYCIHTNKIKFQIKYAKCINNNKNYCDLNYYKHL